MATFDDLYQSFESDSTKRAQQFATFVRWFLRTDPESAQQVTDIWLWADYPGRWLVDSSIDLVFRRKNGETWAVLAKCHAPEDEITRGDIDAFIAESNRADINKRLLIATTDRLEPSVKQIFDAQEKKVVQFLLADFESAEVDYPSSIANLPLLKITTPTGRHGVVVDKLEKDVKGEANQATYTFADMGLGVGDRLQIQLPAMLGQERPVVRLIGYIRGVSVMVTAPTAASGAPLNLVEGEDVVVRLFSAMAVYGFTSSVVRVCKGPVPHLHLEFPSEVQGRVVRAERRIRTNVIASIATRDSEKPISSIITNLSPTGCMLDAPGAIGERDSQIKISLKLNPHGHEHVLELDALIRSVDEPVGSGMTRHGIKFVELSPHTSLIVHSYIYHQLVEHPDSAT